MAGNSTKQQSVPTTLASNIQRGIREGALILFGMLALYFLVSLLTYNTDDPAWSHSTTSVTASNAGGKVGAMFADVFFFLFGYLAYLFPLMVFGAGWLLFRLRKQEDAQKPPAIQGVIRFSGAVFVLCSGTALSSVYFFQADSLLPANSGGVLGSEFSGLLIGVFNTVGATLFLIALLLAGISLATGMSWIKLMDTLGQWVMRAMTQIRTRLDDAKAAREAKKKRVEAIASEQKRKKLHDPPKIGTLPPAVPVASKPAAKNESSRVEKEKQLKLFAEPANVSLPALSLLDLPSENKRKASPESLEAIARLVEFKLKDFNIDVEVVAVYPGPVITRFELQPAPGVKSSQISNLAKDLARSLSVVSVRVVEVIPGKPVIGLEIPNEEREMVRLIEVLQTREYDDASSPLTLGLGKDIGGHPMVADLAKMPHLLVAGTTGSGKSVAVNAMVLSLLYSATPQQVRLIMIDPKMLELSVYDGIPHLLAPVVTDMKEAANALRWCVAEMERRYKVMSAVGVRNIAGFNRKVREAEAKKEPIMNPLHDPQSFTEAEPLKELPLIVVIVDELADMMMVVGKKVEELIARLAQKARAAGIHLILATQRPSVDVLTGLIKANIPTRIAFQVSSKIDSRTIIDQGGAEQLLGHGDMLYLPPGTGMPIRIHGAFVDDHEVHNVVNDLKSRGEPDYNEEILAGDVSNVDPALIPGGVDNGENGNAESDPLYDQAVDVVLRTRRASVSNVQRRLKIGYNRAARLVEAMEEAGLVSAPQSNGQREVLLPEPVE
ncbi:MAG: DNA translocase FtsK 4TM domain-containing protein [Gammaproteobacteria bacterium]|nr:DNA translocase FtsK 4TM domain-containing protein [Gammaproteobacteria bacterium]